MRTLLYRVTVWAILILAGICLLVAMVLNALRFPVPVVARVADICDKLLDKGNDMVIQRQKGNSYQRYF